MRKLLSFLTAFFLCTVLLPLHVEAESAPEMAGLIIDVEDLEQLRENPSGTFTLMNDLDLSGVDWKPVNFSGTFNGNGHSILNCNITSVTEETEVTWDGNMKPYDTHFAGFFGILKNAHITGLDLVNETIAVTNDADTFVGGIAGYMEDSVIDQCSVQGRLRMDVSCKMFGIAGVLGFGRGSITSTNADVELICIDQDRENRDEQFMGGLVSVGYPTITDCNVKIDGYDSDHGYVHDGGLVGMFMFWPEDVFLNGGDASIGNNHVEGMITFFEDNTDRRAYCDGWIGEIESWGFTNLGNNDTASFVRNEVFDYSTDLLPHYDTDVQYTETPVTSDCHEFSYVLKTCPNDGYEFRDQYQLKNHSVDTWTAAVASTYETEGYETGICSVCGETVARKSAVEIDPSVFEISQISALLSGKRSVQLSIASKDEETLPPAGVWTSSDESVATVDAEGLVTAVGSGKAEVQWAAKEGEEPVFTCNVTVLPIHPYLIVALFLVLFASFVFLSLLNMRRKAMKHRKNRINH